MQFKDFLILLVLLFDLLPVKGWASDETPSVIFRAMQEEMSRSLNHLKFEDFPTPYYVNYQLHHNLHSEVLGSLGALLDTATTEKRVLFVDVRVGTPKFDSSTPQSHQYQVEQFVPLDNKLGPIKRSLWYETDLRYKQAIMNFLKKKSRHFSGVENYEEWDFSMGNPPVVWLNDAPKIETNLHKWEDLVRKVSETFGKSPDIEKSSIKISLDHSSRYLLDSDGNQIRDGTAIYTIALEAWTKNEAGIQIHDEDKRFFTTPEKIPSETQLIELAAELVKRIKALAKSPKTEPYVGPAIFSPDATAVLFHEAIGHRLEGSRLRTVSDGKTFLKKIGTYIVPEFITVEDNPGLQSYQGQDLLGHYQYDDEGQRGEKVVLVEKGVLKNILLSRTPVLGFRKTNGHARSDGIKAPMSRMSNFIVRSDNQVSLEQLKNILIKETKRQNKPYGLIVKKMISGETITDTRDFQMFKGTPLYLFKIYPEDGREEMVRGLEFLGTPLSLIRKIMATGDDTKVINGYCVAESGSIPVTTITPSVLLSEVEMQSTHEISLRKSILPPPVP